jgi:hypothetical protein
MFRADMFCDLDIESACASTCAVDERLGPVPINRERAQAISFPRRHQPRRPPLAKIRPGSPAPAMGPGITWTALFEFRTIAANILELFRPFEKPPLAALPLFVGC